MLYMSLYNSVLFAWIKTRTFKYMTDKDFEYKRYLRMK